MTPDTTLAAALWYAARGYGVFPCKPGSKEPATPNGFKNGTTDPARIRELFQARHNIGLITDALILDFDVPKDESTPLAQRKADTRQTFRMMEDTFPEVAAAPQHGTPSGGNHSFLALPDGAPHLVTGEWPRGAQRTHGDLRGMGRAYVVAPPSSTPGGRYTVIRPLVHVDDLPVASAGLLEYLQPPEKPATAPRTPARSVTLPGNLQGRRARYVASAVISEHETVAAAPVGARNMTLHVAAVKLGTLVGAGALDHADAFDALLHAAQRCGLPDHEAARTIQSGLNYGRQHPRALGENK